MLQGTKHAIKSFTKKYSSKAVRKDFQSIVGNSCVICEYPYRKFSNSVKQPLAPEILLRNIVSFNIPYYIFKTYVRFFKHVKTSLIVNHLINLPGYQFKNIIWFSLCHRICRIHLFKFQQCVSNFIIFVLVVTRLNCMCV